MASSCSSVDACVEMYTCARTCVDEGVQACEWAGVRTCIDMRMKNNLYEAVGGDAPPTCMDDWHGRLYTGSISASPTARPYPRNRHAVGDAEMPIIVMAMVASTMRPRLITAQRKVA